MMYLNFQGFQKLQQCCVDHYERLTPSYSQRVSIGHRVLHHNTVISNKLCTQCHTYKQEVTVTVQLEALGSRRDFGICRVADMTHT